MKIKAKLLVFNDDHHPIACRDIELSTWTKKSLIKLISNNEVSTADDLLGDSNVQVNKSTISMYGDDGAYIAVKL